MNRRYALLIDGGFIKYQLGTAAVPTDHAAVTRFVEQVKALDELKAMSLHRVYFYDSKPLEGTSINPLDGTVFDFGASPSAARNKSLHAALCRAPYFSLRFGDLVDEGWQLKARVLHKAKAGKHLSLSAADIKTNVRQKGVDMRIGLDIAHLTLKKHADVIVLATADSDFIPAMKFARREGAQLFLVTLGHGIKEGMREHADLVIESLPTI